MNSSNTLITPKRKSTASWEREIPWRVLMNKELYFREVINASLQQATSNGLTYCIASWDNEDGGSEIRLIEEK